MKQKYVVRSLNIHFLKLFLTLEISQMIAKKYKLKYFEASGKIFGTVKQVMDSVSDETIDVHV